MLSAAKNEIRFGGKLFGSGGGGYMFAFAYHYQKENVIKDSIDLVLISSNIPQHIGKQQSLTAASCGRSEKMALNQQGY